MSKTWDPMDCSLPCSSIFEISRQEYWSGLPFLSARTLPKPVIEPVTPLSPALAGRFFAAESPGKPEGFLVAA